MVVLWNRADHYIFMLWFLLLLYFPRLISAVTDCMSAILHTWCGLSANLRCRSETCCTRLAENTGREKVAKNRHLGTIAQLCLDVSSQLRHVSTIGKKLVKQQYVPQMSPTNFGPLAAEIGLPVWGTPFQRLSSLGSVTARQSSTERQTNFAALNRGRHLCSTGRPSCWALAHILIGTFVANGVAVFIVAINVVNILAFNVTVKLRFYFFFFLLFVLRVRFL